MPRIGTIHIELSTPYVDEASDSIQLVATFYGMSKKWSETIDIPISDLDVIRRIEEAHGVVFVGLSSGYFVFAAAEAYDPDGGLLTTDPGAVTRVPIPDSLRP